MKAYLGEQHGKSHDEVFSELIPIIDLSLPLFGGEDLGEREGIQIHLGGQIRRLEDGGFKQEKQ